MALSLSQILASDAPLLSPVSPTMQDFSWDIPFYHHPQPSPPPSATSSASPVQPHRVLKARMSPDALPDACVSTQQLFELANSPSPPSPSPSHTAPKRSASPPPAAVKKPRAQGERIASKDFIPPDVTGLTKREARLVKNRAAAFLSRQRKREEFEHMEERVAELESENARLLALTRSSQDSPVLSEVDQLKAELAAARSRERELAAQLASQGSPPVKVEAPDATLSISRSCTMPSPNKTGASLGLMVLLCALPSLLSMPCQPSAQNTSFTIPTPLPPSHASSFDLNSYLPTDYDWSRSTHPSIIELDADHHPTNRRTRTLQFSHDSDALGNLDISFDATPSKNGKIRVRIHPTHSSASSRASSPSSSSSWDSNPDGAYSAPSPSSMSSASSSSSLSTSAFSPIATSDPFFGIGSPTNDFGGLFDNGNFGMLYSPASHDEFNYVLPSATLQDSLSANIKGSAEVADALTSAAGFTDLGNGEFSIPHPQVQGQKRRVRIALKSMPQAGGAEGGEWEVQIC